MKIPQAITIFLSLFMYPKIARRIATVIKNIADPHNRVHDLKMIVYILIVNLSV